MALIFRGKTKCALCDTVLKSDDRIVATSHFIADRKHPLWRFSDAAMHKTCFLDWEQRQAFIDLFNKTLGSIIWDNGANQFMRDDGTITFVQQQEQRL
ncbi:MAG: hypothetical protein AB7U82_30140 [Blastocatellales bacterium]